MKAIRIVWFCFVVSIAVLICLATDKTETKPKPPPAAKPVFRSPESTVVDETRKLPVIGHLETRDRILTIQSGPDGLRYLVMTKEGQVLHENLSEEQLKAQVPEIHELIKTSVADRPSSGGAFLDARL